MNAFLFLCRPPAAQQRDGKRQLIWALNGEMPRALEQYQRVKESGVVLEKGAGHV